MLVRIYRYFLKLLYKLFSRFNGKLPPIKLVFLNQRHPTYKMRTEYDCENAAIINALSLKDTDSYDKIEAALLRLRWLGWLQNPMYGNPWNVKASLEELGYCVDRVDPDELSLNDRAIILIHWDNWEDDRVAHILNQHWIAYENGMLHMGDGDVVSLRSVDLAKKYPSPFGSWCYKITVR